MLERKACMLNEERIKLMTKLASYEENEGKRYMKIGSYFRSDYVGLYLLKAFISATIVFLIAVGIWLFYSFEQTMKDIYQIDLLEFGRKVLIYYVAFVAIYSVISYFIGAYRYSQAKKSLKKYYSNLKELSDLYEDDSRR